MAELDKDVARLIGTYQSAAFDKDVDAFMRLYDPSVRVFDAWGVWAYEGAPAWRRAVEGWFTSLGTERVRVSFDDVLAWAGKDVSSVCAIARCTTASPGSCAPWATCRGSSTSTRRRRWGSKT